MHSSDETNKKTKNLQMVTREHSSDETKKTKNLQMVTREYSTGEIKKKKKNCKWLRVNTQATR